MNARWLVVALVFAATLPAAPSKAQVASVPSRLTEAVLQMPDTLRARMLAALARGDLAGAISMWELEMGRSAPKWLQAFQSAFSAENQRAGPCIEVARGVFEGFKRLGANPSYIRFAASGTRRGDKLIAFELRVGDPHGIIQLSNNAVHYAVQIGDRIYDAMTGPTGLPVADYMARLHSPGVLSMQTVSQLP
jgi:hypothetical protein